MEKVHANSKRKRTIKTAARQTHVSLILLSKKKKQCKELKLKSRSGPLTGASAGTGAGLKSRLYSELCVSFFAPQSTVFSPQSLSLNGG